MPSTSLRSPKPKDCSGMRKLCASGGRRETGEVRSGDGLVMTSRSEPLPSPLSSSGSGGALPIDVQCTHRVPSRLESRRRMQTVLAITAGVMIAEAIGGWLAHSLALLADAGHMLADVAAIGLSLAVAYLAQRPATAERTFGLLRLEILAALVNGAVLLEAAPAHIPLSDVHDRIASVPGVASVHDLHVWTVTSGVIAMSGHLVVQNPADNQRVLEAVQQRLGGMGIRHVTVQMERDPTCE